MQDGGLGDGTAAAHAFVAAEVSLSWLRGAERERALARIATQLRPRRMVLFARRGCRPADAPCLIHSSASASRSGGGKRPLQRLTVEVRPAAEPDWNQPRVGTRPHCGIRTLNRHLQLFAAAWAKAWACYGLVEEAEDGQFGPVGSARGRETRVNGSHAAATASAAALPSPPRRPYDFVAYLRTDLWFALPPPSIETFSREHVSVPFCNPLPPVTRCSNPAYARVAGVGAGSFDVRGHRYRSTPGYYDSLVRAIGFEHQRPRTSPTSPTSPP
jgi:hypothetical protein